MTAVMNNAQFPVQVKENAATLLILLRSRGQCHSAHEVSVTQFSVDLGDPTS